MEKEIRRLIELNLLRDIQLKLLRSAESNNKMIFDIIAEVEEEVELRAK